LLDNYQEALKDYTKVIELDPVNAGAYSNRGIVHARLGNNQEAVNDSNKALALAPDDDMFYYNAACMYSIQRIPDKACYYLLKSIEKGYKDWDWIKKDKDFDNIRNEDCYKIIIKDK